jgi:hypothetical protein
MMTLSFIVKDNKTILKNGSKNIDEVGPWETEAEAEAWGVSICEKYNAPEYADVAYPDELPKKSVE